MRRNIEKRPYFNIPIEYASEDIKIVKTKKTPYFCRNLKDFSANTSLHGIKFIGESDWSKFERIWWLIIVTLSFCCCSYLINKIWIKWNTSPVIVCFEENSTPVWDIPFPAVTICPTAKTIAEFFNFSRACDPNVELTEDEYAIYGVTSMFCIEKCLRNASEFISSHDFISFYTVAPQKFCLEYCSGLGGDDEECDDIIAELFTEDGICFTLNMLSANEIFSENKTANIIFSGTNKTSEGWNIETGYPPDAPFYTYPYRAKANGIMNSFKINLIHEKKNTDLKCNAAVSGFKVILHPPHIIPNSLGEVFWVRTDTVLSVSLTPNVMVTSPELRSYSPKVRQCYFTNEKKLKFFKEYSREHCELECMTNLTLDVCGCVTPMMPRNDFTRVCGLGKLPCTEYVKDEFVKIGIPVESKGVNVEERLAFEKATNCDCLPSCTSITYDTSISVTDFDMDSYKKVKNLTDYYYGISISTLSIYFKESDFIRLKRSELYGLVDFLANCGGLLGVFLGFSILSLVEIFYFFFIRVIIKK